MLEVFDYITGRVLFIELTDEMKRSIDDDYDNDIESWIVDNGIDDKFGFDTSNANWMMTDGKPETVFCKAVNGEMVDVHLFL